jgi:type IV fimbrial biogenesis protein FimT
MRARRDRQSGITLVETGVVTAIAAITVSTAVPSFNGLVETQRLAGAAAQLASDLQTTRIEAVLRHTPLRLSLQSADWGQCYVIHSGGAGDCTCGASGPSRCTGDAREVKTVQLPASDRVALKSNVDSMLFDPLHGTATPAGTLQLVAASGRSIHHVVNVMGRVRSCTPGDTASTVSGYLPC